MSDSASQVDSAKQVPRGSRLLRWLLTFGLGVPLIMFLLTKSPLYGNNIAIRNGVAYIFVLWTATVLCSTAYCIWSLCKKSWKQSLFSILPLLLLICFAANIFWDATRQDCGSKPVKTIFSPNKTWNVFLHDDYCYGLPWNTWMVYVVTIKSSSQATKHLDVYETTDDGYPQDIPIISWISNTHVQITTIKDPSYTLHESAFKGIKISYIYRAINIHETPFPTWTPTTAPR